MSYYQYPIYRAPYGMYRYKQAAQPPMDPSMMGGAPPMDPSMMGGAPPMDPSMMGGAPPMDPSMGGGGAPPMDPGMMGAPPIDPAAAGLPPAAPPPPGAPAPGAPADPNAAPSPEEGKKGGKTQKIDDVLAKVQKCLYALQVQVALIMKSLNISIPPEVLIESSNPDGPDISNPTPNLLDLGDVGGLEGNGGKPDIDINPPMGGDMPKEGSWNGPIINLLRRNLGIADVLK